MYVYFEHLSNLSIISIHMLKNEYQPRTIKRRIPIFKDVNAFMMNINDTDESKEPSLQGSMDGTRNLKPFKSQRFKEDEDKDDEDIEAVV